VRDLARRFAAERGPAHWDRSRYTDEAGFETVVCAAYWDDPARHEPWFARRAATGRASSARSRHLHRSAASARRALRDAVLRTRPRRGHRRARRSDERRR
jgi:hypothetical protein